MFNISGFRSSIEKNGVLRPNRFIAFFNLPPYLDELKGQYGYEDGLIALRCESAQLPGLNIATIDQPRIGWGPAESVPHNLTYSEISLVFLMDAQSKIHKLFYDWMNTIVNFQGSRGQSTLDRSYKIGSLDTYAYEVGYKDKYTTDISISVYDNYASPTEAGEGTAGYATEYGSNPVLNVKMFKCYPKTLPNIDLSWGSEGELVRLPIPFAFTDFIVEYPMAETAFRSGTVIGNQNTTISGKPNPAAQPETAKKSLPTPQELKPTEFIGTNSNGRPEVKDLNRFTQEMRNGK